MKTAKNVLSNLFMAGLILAGIIGIFGYLDESSKSALPALSAPADTDRVERSASELDGLQAELMSAETANNELPPVAEEQAQIELVQINKRLIGTVDLKSGGVGPLDFNWPAEELSEITTDASIDLALFLNEGDGDEAVAFVDLEYTLVFTTQQAISATIGSQDPVLLNVGPKSEGSLTGNQLNLLSERHPYTTESGQAVERQFRLTAGPSPTEGVWLGEYRETVWGMGPDPFTVIGNFELREVPLSDTAVVVNNPPQGTPDEANVAAGDSINIDVLANDMALEGALDPTTVTIVEQPTKGTVTVNAVSGEVSYTAAATSDGVDIFRYTVKDSRGFTTANIRVTVTINGIAPLAAADAAGVDGGQSVTVEVLTNDRPVEGELDPASVTIVQQPTQGSVSVNPETGIVTYTAAERSSGTDTFSYSVKNSGGIISAPAIVTITINDIVPKASPDEATVDGGQSVAIAVLENDQALKGELDPATVMIVQQPTLGTISIDPQTGVVTYAAATESEGTDTFTYTVADTGGVQTEAATVTVTVNKVDVVEPQGDPTIYLPIIRR